MGPKPGGMRVGPLVNVQRLVRTLGCDPDPVFERAGLDARQVLCIEDHISYHAASRLVATAAEASGCEHFGLLLGQWSMPTHIGIAGQLALTAPHLGGAIDDIITFLDLHDRGGTAAVRNTGHHILFGYTVTEIAVDSPAQIYDLSITIMYGIMRAQCGAQWQPAEVHLCRPEPEDSRPWRDYFRAPVVFNAIDSGLLILDSWLDHPLPGSDSKCHGDLLIHASGLKSGLQAGFTSETRRQILQLPGEEEQTATALANRLGLHERTLHRRLRAEGTSFRELLAQVRMGLSRQFLEATGLPVQDIAIALGYSGTATFDHAFRRWHGMSPTEWRRNSGMGRPARH